jgi:hypothetical protein
VTTCISTQPREPYNVHETHHCNHYENISRDDVYNKTASLVSYSLYICTTTYIPSLCVYKAIPILFNKPNRLAGRSLFMILPPQIKRRRSQYRSPSGGILVLEAHSECIHNSTTFFSRRTDYNLPIYLSTYHTYLLLCFSLSLSCTTHTVNVGCRIRYV